MRRALNRGRLAASLALAGVLAAGLLASGALGTGGADSRLIVVDRSIGDVSIGMSQTAVTTALGAPESTLDIVLPGGGAGHLDRYTLHGEPFFVSYDAAGLVVAIETYSRYYRTAAGTGVHSPLARVAAGGGFQVDFCLYGYWNGDEATPRTQVVTVFLPAGELVSSVLVTELALYTECEAAQGEVTPPQAPAPGAFRLHVDVDTPGSGFVQSSPLGINCPTDCEGPFVAGKRLTLRAGATSGFTLDHWSGDCTGSAECVLTMDRPRSVTAHFTGQYVPPPPAPGPDRPQTTTTGDEGGTI